MIQIQLSRWTVASARIATSPLSELVGALELLHRYAQGPAPWPYTDWAEQARDVLRSVPETAPLRVYGRLLEMRRTQRTPDVFHPVSDSAAPRLDDELDLLRRTPQSLVDAQLAAHCPHGPPGWLATYQSDRSRSFAALAENLSVFWHQAMRPFWPKMRAVLEEEVVFRARAIVTGGAESVLGDLSGVTRWAPPVLSLPKAHDSRVTTVDQRLLLVPLIFADQQVTCSTDQPDLLRLTYQSRGTAVLASGAPPPSAAGTDRLVTLLGPRRAQVLRVLTTPATTSGLAATLGLPPSTVSEQLTALHAAGVVRRRRAGRQVFYGLEPAGRALLALFGPEDSATPNRFSSPQPRP